MSAVERDDLAKRNGGEALHARELMRARDVGAKLQDDHEAFKGGEGAGGHKKKVMVLGFDLL